MKEKLEHEKLKKLQNMTFKQNCISNTNFKHNLHIETKVILSVT